MTPVLPSLLAKTIARTLPVTLNPANDHIKAILAKTGAAVYAGRHRWYQS